MRVNTEPVWPVCPRVFLVAEPLWGLSRLLVQSLLCSGRLHYSSSTQSGTISKLLILSRFRASLTRTFFAVRSTASPYRSP